MQIIDFVRKEFSGFKKAESVFFLAAFIFITVISFVLNDDKIALISAISGITYTILAGKGKVICYLAGITGTICYCFLAYKNAIWGNFFLWALYYFPMEIIGTYKWLKHYKKDKNEIKKTRLGTKNALITFPAFFIISILFGMVLKTGSDKTPFLDSFATVFSILGQFLTVKRCIEQWYVWLFVNLISLFMWTIAYINGSKCLATIIMWFIYVILSFYFYIEWKKDLQNDF